MAEKRLKHSVRLALRRSWLLVSMTLSITLSGGAMTMAEQSFIETSLTDQGNPRTFRGDDGPLEPRILIADKDTDDQKSQADEKSKQETDSQKAEKQSQKQKKKKEDKESKQESKDQEKRQEKEAKEKAKDAKALAKQTKEQAKAQVKQQELIRAARVNQPAPTNGPDAALISILRDLAKALSEPDANLVNDPGKRMLLVLAGNVLTRATAPNSLIADRVVHRIGSRVPPMTVQAWGSGLLQLSGSAKGSVAAVWAKHENGLVNLAIEGNYPDDTAPTGKKVGQFVVLVNGKSLIEDAIDIQTQARYSYWRTKVLSVQVEADCLSADDLTKTSLEKPSHNTKPDDAPPQLKAEFQAPVPVASLPSAAEPTAPSAPTTTQEKASTRAQSITQEPSSTPAPSMKQEQASTPAPFITQERASTPAPSMKQEQDSTPAPSITQERAPAPTAMLSTPTAAASAGGAPSTIRDGSGATPEQLTMSMMSQPSASDITSSTAASATPSLPPSHSSGQNPVSPAEAPNPLPIRWL